MFARRFSRIVHTCVALLCCGAGIGALAQTARVLSPVDRSSLQVMPGNSSAAKQASSDLGPLASDLKLDRMILLLQPSDAQQTDLKTYLDQQNDSTSPNFHHWLTPQQFGERFGVAPADIAQITQWLQSEGFAVDQVAAGQNMMVFSGTHGQLQSAFHTVLHSYVKNGSTFTANVSDPQIPSALAPVVRGLVSLNSLRRQAAHHDLGTFTLNSKTGSVTPKGVGPASLLPATDKSASSIRPDFNVTINGGNYKIVAPYDFAQIYDLKPLWAGGYDGTGQTISIVSPSDFNLSDVDSFRAQFGLPAKKVTVTYVGPNPGRTANEAETALDVEWSGAVAKGATINLVVAGSTATTDGVDLSAAYIVDNALAPVMSVSYGACEYGLGAAGNAFYNALWQQAAAEGISVFISSGDAGAATCDQGEPFSRLGLSVNGIGSTPYNVSVGGTDFYGTYTNSSLYWGTANDPTTLQSALSYIPEIPWDDSCASPQILGALQARGYTETTPAQLCNNTAIRNSAYFNVGGGGGGASSCLNNTDGTIATCTGGYPKPTWQSGVGVPNDSVRDVPDVALFAADGIFGTFYPYCLSEATPDGSCNLSVASDIQGAGGTSFASPAMAGIMAIVDQKMQGSQGNPNPVLYKLAALQSSLNCSALSSSASASCIFHDPDSGSNSEPCFNAGGAKDCVPPSSTSIWGILSGYNAGQGFDQTTGLGSVDANNLVQNWSSVTTAMLATQTTFTLSGGSSTTYGAGLNAIVKVSSSTAGVPSGQVAILTGSSISNTASDAMVTLANAAASLKLTQLPVGSYSITAHYGGDATFSASTSSSLPVVITQTTSATSIAASRLSLASNQSTTLTLSIQGAGSGIAPTGTVHLVDQTSGIDLGTFSLLDSGVAALAGTTTTLQAASFYGGSNTIRASYSGDSNYGASTGSVAIILAAPMSLSLSQSTLALPTDTVTKVASSMTLVSANGGTLAYPIQLACSGSLPVGASCNVSSSALTSGTTAAITVSYTATLTSQTTPTGPLRQAPTAGTLAAVGILFGFCRRRKTQLRRHMAVVACFVFLSFASGCAGGNDTPGTALTLNSSAASSPLGSSITLTTTAVSTQGTPSGSVSLVDTYRNQARSLGTVTLQSGAGTFTTSSLGLGLHSLSAIYGGDAGHGGAVSSFVPVVGTYTATLAITATDANGITISTPLVVNFQ